MKGADQVLALRRVDSGLAADRGIHLRQQRGRHLHEIEAAADDRGGKTGEVADHAAAERDHEIVALDLGLDQFLADKFDAFVTLRGLSFVDDNIAMLRCRRLAATPRSCAARWVATYSSVTMATRAPGRSAAIRSPSDDRISRPMTMS